MTVSAAEGLLKEEERVLKIKTRNNKDVDKNGGGGWRLKVKMRRLSDRINVP